MLARARRAGHFEYRVMLPGQADAGKITASLADGVLTVTIPKVRLLRTGNATKLSEAR